MSNIAVCTSLYEAGRPYLDAFIAGVNSACGGHDAMLVAAVHGLDEPKAALAALDGSIAIRLEKAPATASIAEVRRLMLLAAAACGAEILVLVDR